MRSSDITSSARRTQRGRLGGSVDPTTGRLSWNPKAEPTPGFALDPDLAAHQLDQLAGDGKAEPGALVGAVALVLDLVELAEHVVELVGRDADAGVFDRDDGCAAVSRVVLRQADDPDQHMALGGELDRVADRGW